VGQSAAITGTATTTPTHRQVLAPAVAGPPQSHYTPSAARPAAPRLISTVSYILPQVCVEIPLFFSPAATTTTTTTTISSSHSLSWSPHSLRPRRPLLAICELPRADSLLCRAFRISTSRLPRHAAPGCLFRIPQQLHSQRASPPPLCILIRLLKHASDHALAQSSLLTTLILIIRQIIFTISLQQHSFPPASLKSAPRPGDHSSLSIGATNVTVRSSEPAPPPLSTEVRCDWIVSQCSVASTGTTVRTTVTVIRDVSPTPKGLPATTFPPALAAPVSLPRCPSDRAPNARGPTPDPGP
jgi:hypothetical protein